MKARQGTSLTCERVRETFLRWVEDEVDDVFAKELEVHVAGCQMCSSDWEEYRSTVTWLRSLEPVEVPEWIFQRIRARLHEETVWQRLVRWVLPAPRRVAAPALATIGLLLVVTALWRFGPWQAARSPQSPPAVALKDSPSLLLGPAKASRLPDLPTEQILPGADELLRPAKALEAFQEQRLTLKATLQDDLVLDLTGSEEVFNQIEEILREVHGRMFLVGIRQRNTGRVIRSRMVLQVPLEHHRRVIQRIESLGKVHHLFFDRDAVPPPPDRLRIRVLAVTSMEDSPAPLQETSEKWDSRPATGISGSPSRELTDTPQR